MRITADDSDVADDPVSGLFFVTVQMVWCEKNIIIELLINMCPNAPRNKHFETCILKPSHHSSGTDVENLVSSF